MHPALKAHARARTQVQTIGGLLNFPENEKEKKQKILEHAVVAVGRLVAARAKRLQAAPGPTAAPDFLAPPGASSMDHLRLPYDRPV